MNEYGDLPENESSDIILLIEEGQQWWRTAGVVSPGAAGTQHRDQQRLAHLVNRMSVLFFENQCRVLVRFSWRAV